MDEYARSCSGDLGLPLFFLHLREAVSVPDLAELDIHSDRLGLRFVFGL